MSTIGLVGRYGRPSRQAGPGFGDTVGENDHEAGPFTGG